TGTSGNIGVSSASAADIFVITASSVTSGVPFSYTVNAVDQFGNLDSSYNGAIHFSSDDSSDVFPPDSALSHGSGSFEATFVATNHEHTITATDTANPSITGSSIPIAVNESSSPGATAAAVAPTITSPSTVTFMPGGPSSFTITTTGSPAAS